MRGGALVLLASLALSLAFRLAGADPLLVLLPLIPGLLVRLPEEKGKTRVRRRARQRRTEVVYLVREEPVPCGPGWGEEKGWA
uniref:Uncharacterized protein n=1 Tax=Thermus tengchongensis TaxID=1214928 RepID=A0A7V3ZZJ6_9DEIN